MHTSSTKDSNFEVIKFLYQYKDDNKYYKLDESILNGKSHEERHNLLYSLRDSAFIATDRELYYNNPLKGLADPKNPEVKAKILPKGIVAVETFEG